MIASETHPLRGLNWALLGLAFFLFALGVLNLYSASSLRGAQGLALAAYYKKQLVWGGFALGTMVLCMSFDYRYLEVIVWPFYGLTVLLLLMVPVWGKTITGAQRWLSLGLFNLQPSELAKVAVVLVGARMLSKAKGGLDWRNLSKVLALAGLPAGLIILQPDLGTGLSLLLLLGGMIIYKGLERPVGRTLLVLLPLIAPFCWFFLHDYQKQRILTFLHPDRDPLGSGYHVLQSQIAVGSGQLWGKGFLGGTQSQLRFLPEKHTDFAFAVFGEEWGFIGCMLLLSAFCLFLFQISLVAQRSKDGFGSLLAIGVFFYFFWQILINMGMVLGLVPVVGIPLPFLSYGGSSMIVNFCLLGMVLNVSMRRFVFKDS
jgi:rod shape determining protein RodA